MALRRFQFVSVLDDILHWSKAISLKQVICLIFSIKMEFPITLSELYIVLNYAIITLPKNKSI